MRILTVVRDLGSGGIQRAAQNFSIGLHRAGHEVAVLAYNTGGPRVRELKRHSVPVFIGDGSKTDNDPAYQQAARWQPTLVHFHRPGRADVDFGFLLRYLKRASGKDLRVLETNSFGKADYSKDASLIDVHLQKAQWSLWKWRKWTRGFGYDPIGAVVPNTVDTRQFYRADEHERELFRDQHDIPRDAFVFGRIGQKARWKWSPIIFDAFSRVANHHDRAHLLLIGLPDELRPPLNQLQPAVRNRVTVLPPTGADSTLRVAYSTMDVFLHAAHIGESFGTVLAEAMLCGCPAITLNTPARDNSQLEVVGHNEGGLVVSNLSSMKTAMSQLIQDEAMRKRLARGASERIENRYAMHRVMPTLLKIVNLTSSCRSRTQLRKSLQDDPDITTHISDADIYRLRAKSMGAIPVKQKILMKLGHSPYIYRLWNRLHLDRLPI